MKLVKFDNFSRKIMLKMAIVCAVVVAVFSFTETKMVEAKIRLNKSKVTISVGKSMRLKMIGTKNKITWKSLNKKIATVKDGKIIGKKKGKVKIIATVSGKKFICYVLVKDIGLKSISLNKESIVMTEDESYDELRVKYTPSNTTVNKDIIWNSSNTNIADVSEYGQIYAYSVGTVEITAQVGNKIAKCKVTVKPKIESISLNKTELALGAGESERLVLTIYPSDATYEKITWTSEDNKVATVSNGVVKAVSAGVTKIVAKVDEKTVNCTVYVTKGIGYISDRGVEYYSLEQEHRIFFAFKLKDGETRVADEGTASIKIINEDNVEVYNKEVSFDESNFGYWTDKYSNTKYLGCIEIKDSELIKSTAKSGKLTFSIKLNDGTSFKESTYNIDDLPLIDFKEVCKITMPSIPVNITDYSYSDRISTKTNVTGADYIVKKMSNGKYYIKLLISGEKIYDLEGKDYSKSCRVGWKLYKEDNIVVGSGTIYTPALKVGDKFENVDSVEVDGLEAGNYRLELLNVN